MNDTKTRSVLKAITYKIGTAIIILLLVYCLSQDIKLTIEIAGLEFILALVYYFIHERIWNKIKWGRC